MREIKFRAWADGKMHHQSDGQWWMFGDSGFWSLSRIEPEEINICDSLESENPVLMQYTGIKDRNGVEIYEGDIVTIWHEELFCEGDQTGVVEWDKSGGWLISFDSVSIVLTSIDLEFACPLVIGNVYENPELLAPAAGDEEGT